MSNIDTTRSQSWMEELPVPPDEVGWTEETFNMAVRYVSQHMTYSEVWDMTKRFMDQYRYGVSPPVTFWLKRPTLLMFQNDPPSRMAEAYNFVKSR